MKKLKVFLIKLCKKNKLLWRFLKKIKNHLTKLKKGVKKLKRRKNIFLTNLSKKNYLFRITLRKIRHINRKSKYIYYMLTNKVDDKVILFEAFGGRNYTCSPKAIYEKMLTMEEFNDYKFVWSFINTKKHKIKEDERLIIVKTNSEDYFKYFASAKYWIVNSMVPLHFIKKKDQIYIQCWHGTPLKKLRYDIKADGNIFNTQKEWKKSNDIDAKRFDFFISPSKYCTEKFTSAFNLKALNKEHILIEEGYPRNDSLFNIDSNKILKLKKKLKINSAKKVLLYVPTFRDNQHESGVGYTYDLQLDFKLLREKIGNNYIVLFRAHYLVASKIDFSEYKDFVVNVSNYDDINDLYIISDIIITDYSSVFFDFANLKRPIIFYMYDYDEYKNKLRDFYISMDELPGPIVKTQKELEKAILDTDKHFVNNQEKYEKLNNKYNYLDDGNASERVIRRIFK
ncbi:MAG: CDP-glycerol glycerophosphotransferase family protein [Erysipelotrichaceae bacterium]|jgi:CDP-glycerol glycerophosphotransferase|nr:CDP-glycerol glycerophosphotransferase family protein [Erysipelotrichia bacterium]